MHNYKEDIEVTEISSDEEGDLYRASGSEKCFHEGYKKDVFGASEDTILDDALYVYDYVNQVFGIDEKDIILFGRSIGSGPVTHVASKRKPGCVFLMSAFKSIQAIAEDRAGTLLKYLI